jgi:RHS repeat-associated protein
VYNADNELTSRRFSGGPNGAQLRADISYNADGEMTLLKRYADTAGTQFLGQTQYTNDPIGNVTEIKHTNSSGTVLEDFTYSLDAGSRLTSETDTINGTPTTTNDSYDSSNQLTSSGAKSYNWDLEGNPTNNGYQVGPDNQLITDGNWNYKYDPEGNVIEKDGVAGGPDAGLVWKYGYDNENHLTSAVETNASNQVLVQDSFLYDVNNNRVESDVTVNGTTTVTKYAYDQNGQVWADLNSTNGIITRRQYLDTVDSLFARIGSDGTEAWYLTDHLGSVRGLMNNSGSLIDSLSYDAFGNITNESSPANGDRYKYTGREWNAELNLQYTRARFYEPATGRWISQDPLGFDSGDSNVYRYVKNAPTVFSDPSGLIFNRALLSNKYLPQKLPWQLQGHYGYPRGYWSPAYRPSRLPTIGESVRSHLDDLLDYTFVDSKNGTHPLLTDVRLRRIWNDYGGSSVHLEVWRLKENVKDYGIDWATLEADKKEPTQEYEGVTSKRFFVNTSAGKTLEITLAPGSAPSQAYNCHSYCFSDQRGPNKGYWINDPRGDILHESYTRIPYSWRQPGDIIAFVDASKSPPNGPYIHTCWVRSIRTGMIFLGSGPFE